MAELRLVDDLPFDADDAFEGLEERLQAVIDLITTLRSERDTAFEERDAALAERAKLAADRDAAKKAALGTSDEIQRLRGEVEAARGQRKQVMARLEKLLDQVEAVTGES